MLKSKNLWLQKIEKLTINFGFLGKPIAISFYLLRNTEVEISKNELLDILDNFEQKMADYLL